MTGTLLLSNDLENLRKVYGGGGMERLAEISRLYPRLLTADEILPNREALKNIRAIFSTWGMPRLTEEQLDALPSLKAVFYAASSVKPFADVLLNRGIMVVSAWAANAVAVAEFASSEILLAGKGFFRNARESKNPEMRIANRCFTGPGNYGEKVAILGAGQVGRRVLNILSRHDVKLLVVDPFLPAEQAEKWNAECVSMREAFQTALIISNHMPDLPETRGIITEEMFRSMRKDAVFINTGRGASVDEAGMIRVLTERPDLTALLDVTCPEPPVADSPLYTLPNVLLTSHLAGAVNDETRRMAEWMFREFLDWENGKTPQYRVTPAMLKTMA